MLMLSEKKLIIWEVNIIINNLYFLCESINRLSKLINYENVSRIFKFLVNYLFS